MSGGSKTTDQSQTTAPNATAMAGYQNVLGGAQNIAANNQTWNPAMGVNVAGMNNMQTQGFQGIQNQLGQYSPQIQQAMGLASSAGQGVTGADISRFQNPYTQQVIDTTMANTRQQQGAALQNVVGNQIAQNAQGGDRAMLQKALTEGQFALANNATTAGLEQSGYNSALAAAQAQKGQELQASYGLANQAAGAQNYNLQGLNAMIGAGGAQQGQQQNVLNAATQNATSQQMWPMQLQQWLAGITGGMGSLMGGTTTMTSQQTEQPGFFNYLGAGLGALSGFSDERVKENKRVVGELYDGQKVYAFNYKGHPVTQLGLMAQEVEKHHPESVGEAGGVKTVQYDMATHDAEKRGHFANGGAPGMAGGGNPWGQTADPWGTLLQTSPQQAHANFGTLTPPTPMDSGQSGVNAKAAKEAVTGAKNLWSKYGDQLTGGAPSTDTTSLGATDALGGGSAGGGFWSSLGFADGGDVGGMQAHARKMLNLAGGGLAGDPDAEPEAYDPAAEPRDEKEKLRDQRVLWNPYERLWNPGELNPEATRAQARALSEVSKIKTMPDIAGAQPSATGDQPLPPMAGGNALTTAEPGGLPMSGPRVREPRPLEELPPLAGARPGARAAEPLPPIAGGRTAIPEGAGESWPTVNDVIGGPTGLQETPEERAVREEHAYAKEAGQPIGNGPIGASAARAHLAEPEPMPANWDRMTPEEKFVWSTGHGSAAPELPERNIVEKARLDAEREIEAEKRLNASKPEPMPANWDRMTPEEKFVWATGHDSAAPELPEHRPPAPFDMRRAAVIPNLAPGPEENTSWIRPANPPGGFNEPKSNLDIVTDALKRAGHNLTTFDIPPREQAPAAPLTPAQEASKTVPTEQAPAPVKIDRFTVNPDTGNMVPTDKDRFGQPLPSSEGYAAGMPAPKAETQAAEQEARTPMTARLGFEGNIGSVSADTGGWPSVGRYGIHASAGPTSSARDLVHMPGAHELGITADPNTWTGSKEFARQWQRAAKDHPHELMALEDAWHQKYIVGPADAHLAHVGAPQSVRDDAGVKEYMQDRLIQHGVGTTSESNRRYKQALSKSAQEEGGTTPNGFLKALTDIDRAHVPHDFRTSLGEIQDPEKRARFQKTLENRVNNRLAGATDEKVQPGGISEQMTEAAKTKGEAEAAQPKTTADLLPHEQNQVNFVQKILGGWNPLEGITGPGKEGKDSWNPLGLTSDQRRNLMVTGLAMMGGDPLGMRAAGAGVSGLQAGQQMQMNEQSMGVQRAKLALEAMNQPKFQPAHWTDLAGVQHAGSMDVHTGAITEAGQTAPVAPGSIAPGSVQTSGAAGSVQPTGEPMVDRMFQQYPGMRDEALGILDGSKKMESVPMRQRAGMEEAVRAVARQRGETYDPATLAFKNKFRTEYNSGENVQGKLKQSLEAGTTHLGDLVELNKVLPDHNRFMAENFYGPKEDKFGHDKNREAWKTMTHGLAGELAKLASGGEGSDAVQKKWEEALSPDQPREKRAASLAAAVRLMHGSLRGIEQKWDAVVGKTWKKPEILSEESRATIEKANQIFWGNIAEKSGGQQPLKPMLVERDDAVNSIMQAKQAGRTDLVPLIIERARQRGVQGLEVLQ